MFGAITQLQGGGLDAVELATLAHGIVVMTGITNDLLDVEALRLGRLKLTPAPMNVRLVLDACTKTSDREIRVALDVGPDVPPTIAVDALRLRQVSRRFSGRRRCARASVFWGVDVLVLENICPFLDRQRCSDCADCAERREQRGEAHDQGPRRGHRRHRMDARDRGSGGGAGAATAPRELVIEVTDAGPGLRGQTLAQLTTEFGGGGTDPTRYGIRSSGTGISICVM
jgi:hypothetical protein